MHRRVFFSDSKRKGKGTQPKTNILAIPTRPTVLWPVYAIRASVMEEIQTKTKMHVGASQTGTSGKTP